MRSKLLIILSLFLMIGVAGQVFGATLTATLDQVPKGAYVNGGGDDDDDNYYWQILEMEFDEVDGAGETIAITLPTGMTIADTDMDGPPAVYTDEISLAFDGPDNNFSVNAATASIITLDVAADNADGDKLWIMFPVETQITPDVTSDDYTVVFSNDFEANITDGNGPLINYRASGALQIVNFAANLSADDDSTETYGEKYPTGPANLIATLTDIVVDGAAAAKIVAGNVGGLDGSVANDEVTYTLWVSKDSTLSHVAEVETGVLHAIDFDYGGNYTMNEGDDGNDPPDNGRIAASGLEEGEYYLYITSDMTGDFPLCRSGKLTVLHYPYVKLFGFDYDGSEVFDMVGNADDNDVVLDTGDYFGYDNSFDPAKMMSDLDLYIKVDDYDDAAELILFYSTDSSLDEDDITFNAGVVGLTGATAIVDTLNENQEDVEGFITYTWDLSPASDGSYVDANEYYLYAVGNDDKHQHILSCLGTDDADVEKVTLKHSPDFEFDSLAEYEEVALGDVDIDVSKHDVIMISWGKNGVTGDGDTDDSAVISLYIGLDANPDNQSDYASDDDITGLHKITEFLSEDLEAKDQSWYAWDIKADYDSSLWFPTDGAIYHLFALIDENKTDGTTRVVALGDDGLLTLNEVITNIVFTNTGFVRAYDPPADGVTITGEETYRIRFDSFDWDEDGDIGIFVLQAGNATINAVVGGEGPLTLTVDDLEAACDDAGAGVAGAAYCLTDNDGDPAAGGIWLSENDANYYDLTMRLPIVAEADMRYDQDMETVAASNNVDLAAGTYWVYIGVDTEGGGFAVGTETLYRAPGTITFVNIADTDDPPQRNAMVLPTHVSPALGDTITFALNAADNAADNIDKMIFYVAVEKDYWSLVDDTTPFTEDASFSGMFIANQVIDDAANNRWIVRATVFDNANVLNIADDGLGEAVGTLQLVSLGTSVAIEKETSVYLVNEPSNGWVSKFSSGGADVTINYHSSDVKVQPRAIVEGIVELEGRDTMAVTVTLELRERGSYVNVSDAVFYSTNGGSQSAGVEYALDSDGKFTLTQVPTGEYDLVAVYNRYLSELAEVNAYPGIDTLFVNFGTLLGGDCYGYVDSLANTYPDNQVDKAGDVNRIETAFLATSDSSNWDAPNNYKWADINEDGVVEDEDLAMATANTGTSGAQPVYKSAIQPGATNLSAIVELVNAPSELKAGQTYTIQVAARNTDGVRGYFVNLNYDRDALSLEGIKKGDFIHSDSYSFPVVGDGTVGLVNAVYGYALSGGDGVLAEFTFTAISDGAFTSDMLGIQRASLVNADFKKEFIVSENLFGDNSGNAPEAFELSQNFPNPFNPTTTISFSAPKSGHVTINVYDILGRHVRTLVSGNYSAGNYSVVWDATDKNGGMVSAGVYFYTIKTKNFSTTKRMLFMK